MPCSPTTLAILCACHSICRSACGELFTPVQKHVLAKYMKWDEHPQASIRVYSRAFLCHSVILWTGIPNLETLQFNKLPTFVWKIKLMTQILISVFNSIRIYQNLVFAMCLTFIQWKWRIFLRKITWNCVLAIEFTGSMAITKFLFHRWTSVGNIDADQRREALDISWKRSRKKSPKFQEEISHKISWK